LCTEVSKATREKIVRIAVPKKGGVGVEFESGEFLKMSLKLEEGDFDVLEVETYVPGGRHLGT